MDLLTEAWEVEFHSGVPVYRQIVNRIRAAVAAGQLKTGEQLPTIRALREKLDVNPNTVARAYRELEHAGIIETKRGSGCYVAPPGEVTTLSSKEKQARLSQLYDRVAAEAASQGLRLEDLVQHISRRKSHV